MKSASSQIIILEKVDSTNNYAMAMIQQGIAESKKAVFALEQTMGKGRRGKGWTSNKGDNIMLSIMEQMQWLPLSRQFELSVAVALGCHDFISTYHSKNIFIKWPNDLIIDDSKAGGILIENVIHGTLWQWAVIGIGINVNQIEFEDYALKPTSLKLATGKNFNIIALANKLHNCVIDRIESLKSGNFHPILEEYNEKLFGSGKKVKLKKQNIVFETQILKVNSSGQLITLDAMERQFNFDEVEFKGLV